jgi:uncharacterized protein
VEVPSPLILSDTEARVLGCLVEKQRTVPDSYPLTANALVSACNQSSNREPVVDYDEHTVISAVDSLKGKGVARVVHPAHGRSVTRYRHVLDEALGLDDASLALLAVLLLRGPQTPGELRARAERLHVFDSGEEVDASLAGLAGRDQPLVRRLERRPGEREARWVQLLTGDPVHSPAGRGDGATAPPTRDDPGLEGRVAALETEVAELRSVVDRLRALLD